MCACYSSRVAGILGDSNDRELNFLGEAFRRPSRGFKAAAEVASQDRDADGDIRRLTDTRF